MAHVVQGISGRLLDAPLDKYDVMTSESPISKDRHLMSANATDPPRIISDIIEIPTVRYIVIAAHVALIILAGGGNGLLLWYMSKRKKFRKNVTANLILNLALCDFLIAILYQPMRLADILLPFAGNGGPSKLTKTNCQVVGFFAAYTSSVAMHTIVAIALERFLLICYPLKAKGWLTVKVTTRVIISLWVLSFFTTLPLPLVYTFIADIHLKKATLSFCLVDLTNASSKTGSNYVVFLFIVYYAIPVLLISMAYGKIFLTLNRGIGGTDSTDEAVQRTMRTRQNIAKVMLFIAIIFAVCTGPYYCIFLRVSLGFGTPTNPVFTLIVIEFLPLVSAACNPVVYTSFSKALFKQKLLAFLQSKEFPDIGSLKKTIIKASMELLPLHSSHSSDRPVQEKYVIKHSISTPDLGTRL